MEDAPGPAPRTSHLPLGLRILVSLALTLHPHDRERGRRDLSRSWLGLPLHADRATPGARRLGLLLAVSLLLDATRAASRLGLALPTGGTMRLPLGPARHRHYRLGASALTPRTGGKQPIRSRAGLRSVTRYESLKGTIQGYKTL